MFSVFEPKLLSDNSNSKYFKLLCSLLKIYSMNLKFLQFCPKLLEDIKIINFCKLLGIYFIASPSDFIFSILSPNLLFCK